MKVVQSRHAAVSLDGPEVCREFYRNATMWFGTSSLLPGQTGGIDPGHPVSKEIFYVSRGHVIVENTDTKMFYELSAGDALVIDEGEPHQITNIGPDPAEVVWAGAPGVPQAADE